MNSRKHAIQVRRTFILALFILCCTSEMDGQKTFVWSTLDENGRLALRTFPSSTQPTADQLERFKRFKMGFDQVSGSNCHSAKLTVVGDTRAAFDGLGVSIYWQAILRQMKEFEPSVILHLGDLVKRGTMTNEWLSYLESLPLTPAIVAVRGNHDRGEIFYQWGIGISEVFAFTLGPMRIFGFDSEGSRSQLMARLGRLEQLLAQDTKLWKIVALHRPIWSRGLHGSDELGLNERLVQLFDQYGVHIVFSGHDHNYERFCSTRGTADDRKCLAESKGTNFVVTGGGSTMPNPVPAFWRRWTTSNYESLDSTSLLFRGGLHFVELDASISTLRYRAHRSHLDEGVNATSVMDEFVIDREAMGCAAN